VLCWNGVGRGRQQHDHQFNYEKFNYSVWVYILVVKSNEKWMKLELYIVCWVNRISVWVHGKTFITKSKNMYYKSLVTYMSQARRLSSYLFIYFYKIIKKVPKNFLYGIFFIYLKNIPSRMKFKQM